MKTTNIATMMAAFPYLGAGIGLFLYANIEKITETGGKQERLTKKELPYTAAMVLLDIIALLLGESIQHGAVRGTPRTAILRGNDNHDCGYCFDGEGLVPCA